MKMKVQEMNVDNKRIVLRCDFNVPIKDGVILDDTKIVASLETINYLVSKNCRVIILSHLGKVKSEEDKVKNSLAVVAKRLNELVESNVIFSTTTRSPELEMRVKALQPREILVVENTRFEDYHLVIFFLWMLLEVVIGVMLQQRVLPSFYQVV